MAEVKLYIYKNESKGEGITLTEPGGYTFSQNILLPPKIDENDKTKETTIVQTTITNTYKIPVLTLTKLDYKKTIYQPCEIHADLQVDMGNMRMKTKRVTKTTTLDEYNNVISSSETSDEGSYTELNNSISQTVNQKVPGMVSGKGIDLVSHFKGANVEMQIDGNKVAENYMVFKVSSSYKTISGNTSMFLNLTIYSADKKMDLDKYSRAYTAKKLYSDILANEGKLFFPDDKDVDGNCTMVANHTQLMKYKDTETVNSIEYDVTKRDELRIPYIVQYNESFYEFMARAANRYGEFLYFEDGKLNLGMQPSETNYYKRDNKGEILKKDGADVIIDWATEPNAVQNRYFDSEISEGITVEDRAYNYNNHDLFNALFSSSQTDSTESTEENAEDDSADTASDTTTDTTSDTTTDTTSDTATDTTSDTTTDTTSDTTTDTTSDTTTEDSLDTNRYADSSPDSRYRIDPLSSDEWTCQNLTKSGDTSGYVTQGDLWEEESKEHVVGFVCRCLGATSFSDFIVNLAIEMVLEAYKIWQQCKSYNHIMDKHNYDPISNDDQKSGDQFSQFATYLGSSNLQSNLKALFEGNGINNFTELFYPYIRRKEREIGSQEIWLDFGNFYKPIKLGDKLYVDGRDYVVINVEGRYEDKEEHLKVSAIPLLKLTSSTTAMKDATVTNKDAWTDSLPVPPVLKGAIVRDARPQVAFVVETTDPEGLGRIRVRYPWQNADGDSTPWIRVTLPLATSGGGVNFTPSVGDEVMVGYEHGNIDRPYAMGYLPAPFMQDKWHDSLPFDEWGAQHGIKVKTGHHLTFQDGANAANFTANMGGGIVMKALQTVWPFGFCPWPLGNENSADLGGGFELADRYGFYKISGSTDERKVTIESPMGTVELNAFQGITINAPNGDVQIKGKNVTIAASNRLSLSAGNNVKDRFYYQKTWTGKKRNKAVSGLKSFAMGGWESLKSYAKENYFDMGFLRTVLEVLLRPVDGTLQIKSYTFVRIEAGEGSAELPNDSLDKDRWKDKTDGQVLTAYRKAYYTVSLIKKNVEGLLGSIQENYNQVVDAKTELKNLSKIIGDQGKEAITFDKIITYAVGGSGGQKMEDKEFTWGDQTGNDLKDDDSTFTEKEPKQTEDPWDRLSKTEFDAAHQKWVDDGNEFLAKQQKQNDERKEKREKIMATANVLREAAKNLKDEVEKWTGMQKNGFELHGYSAEDVDQQDAANQVKVAAFPANMGIPTLDAMKNGTYDETVKKADNVWMDQKKALVRYITYKYLETKTDIKKNASITNVTNAADNTKWSEYAKSVEPSELKGAALHKERAKTIFTHEWFPWSGLYSGIWENATKWENGFQGKILMSEQEDHTAYFGDNYTLKNSVNRESSKSNLKALKKLIKKM